MLFLVPVPGLACGPNKQADAYTEATGESFLDCGMYSQGFGEDHYVLDGDYERCMEVLGCMESAFESQAPARAQTETNDRHCRQVVEYVVHGGVVTKWTQCQGPGAVVHECDSLERCWVNCPAGQNRDTGQ